MNEKLATRGRRAIMSTEQPAGDIHISWSAPSIVVRAVEAGAVLFDPSYQRPGAQQPWALKLGGETRPEALVVSQVSEQVVPFSAVPAAATHKAVVGIDVDDAVAQGAVVLGIEDRQAKAALEHGGKESGFDFITCVLGRGCLPNCVTMSS